MISVLRVSVRGKTYRNHATSVSISPTLQLQIPWKENIRRKKKASCHSTHENDAFSGDGSEPRLIFRREAFAFPVISHSVFKNRTRLKINKSRTTVVVRSGRRLSFLTS